MSLLAVEGAWQTLDHPQPLHFRKNGEKVKSNSPGVLFLLPKLILLQLHTLGQRKRLSEQSYFLDTRCTSMLERAFSAFTRGTQCGLNSLLFDRASAEKDQETPTEMNAWSKGQVNVNLRSF